jgi:hypothetical protein
LYLIYLYNFDAEKKNFKIIVGKMVKENPGSSQVLETYMSFWLQNLTGLTGKFQLSQLTNVDYWSDAAENEELALDKISEIQGKLNG